MNTLDDRTTAGAGASADGPAPAPGHDAADALSGDARPPSPGTGSDLIDITFKLYATLQDKLPPGTRRNAAPIQVAADVTLNQIIDRFQVPRELAHLVLVNGHFKCEADRDAPGALKAGDVLAIWPPVAGG